MEITHFGIEGLFGTQRIDLPIFNNRLVIVGVNGTGKSTVLTIFYYFIARRWNKLVEMPFKALRLNIDGHTLSLEREEIHFFLRARGEMSRLFRHFSPSVVRQLDEATLNWLATGPDINDTEMERLAAELRIPKSQIQRMRLMLHERTQQETFNWDSGPNISAVSKTLQSSIASRVLFLPTYRRIEKDLKAIVPDIEQQVRRYEEKFGDSHHRSPDSPIRTYIDLVEFGMEDVKSIFANFLASLNEYARQQLNELTGAYLGEVIRGEVDNFDLATISEFRDEEINSVLDRVDERTLTQMDKSNLRTLLSKLHENPGSVTTRDRYIAHFFAKLGTVARTLQEKETPIRNLVAICNENYLYGKKIIYDRMLFTLKVERTDGTVVDLKDLSSGEKQIVSLFTHLYLGRDERYTIFIDEPELSLSVDWQENLLPDIMKSGHCDFLAAVTHSPFIYDNEFDAHTVDLFERISTIKL